MGELLASARGTSINKADAIDKLRILLHFMTETDMGACRAKKNDAYFCSKVDRYR